MQEKHRIMLGSIILFMDSSTMLTFPVYHRFISKNWIYYHVTSLILNGIAIVMMYGIPESPKYLIGKQRFAEAKSSLIQMARINGVGVESVSKLNLEGYDIS